jgi:hypothetical protein
MARLFWTKLMAYLHWWYIIKQKIHCVLYRYTVCVCSKLLMKSSQGAGTNVNKQNPYYLQNHTLPYFHKYYKKCEPFLTAVTKFRQTVTVTAAQPIVRTQLFTTFLSHCLFLIHTHTHTHTCARTHRTQIDTTLCGCHNDCSNAYHFS